MEHTVWVHVTVMPQRGTVATIPVTYYLINTLALLGMLVLEQRDRQMVSRLHFSRSPLIPYDCVFATCKYSFCIFDDIMTLKYPGGYCRGVCQGFTTEWENMGAKLVSRV